MSSIGYPAKLRVGEEDLRLSKLSMGSAVFSESDSFLPEMDMDSGSSEHGKRLHKISTVH